MKELSIEEKAKRYDEAIKLAKDSFNYPDYPGFIRADVVFPELKEKKDDDERVWKELIELVSYCADGEFPHKSEWLSWLELHKERVI